MIIARRFCAERRLSLLWWAIGLAGLVTFTAVFFPTVEGDASFAQVFDDLPDAMRSAMGVVEGLTISSPAGYLQARMFGTLLPLVLISLAVGWATRSVAGDEEAGILELLITYPITRRRLFVERTGAWVGIVAAAVVLVAALTVAVGAPFGLLEGLHLPKVLAACAAAGAVGVFHGALASAVGAATGRPGVARGVASGVAVAGYLAEGVLANAELPGFVRWISPWHWYLHRTVIVDGPALATFLLPVLASVVLLGVGSVLFERRDLR